MEQTELFMAFADAFANKLGELAVLTNHELSEAKIAVFLKYFAHKNYPPQAVLDALDAAAATYRFFPSAAELVELINGGKGGGKNPAVAWQEVVCALENIGSHRDVKFEDGAIAVVIDGLGGWSALGAMTYEDLTLQRIPARFAALYSEAVRCGAHKKPRIVSGRTAVENGSRGLEWPEELFIAETIREFSEKPQSLVPWSKPAKMLPAPNITPEEQQAVMAQLEKLKNTITGKSMDKPVSALYAKGQQRAKEKVLAQKEIERQNHIAKRNQEWV